MQSTVQDRNTKYTLAIHDWMRRLGHATNLELLEKVRLEFPDVSATTIHRITTRLVTRGGLQLAPSGRDNAMRFDVNLASHDHFLCEHCGSLRDANMKSELKPLFERILGDGCSISGNLTVSGICKKCQEKGEKL